MLLSGISQLIFKMVQDYYNEVTSLSIQTGMVLSYKTAADFARWNSHWHELLLEGGFNDEGNFSSQLQ
jgi:hypothetical protein